VIEEKGVEIFAEPKSAQAYQNMGLPVNSPAGIALPDRLIEASVFQRRGVRIAAPVEFFPTLATLVR